MRDIFLEELPGLPPHRKIHFVIVLELDIVPTLKASYIMALVELKELKVQLQKLLNEGFIQ